LNAQAIRFHHTGGPEVLVLDEIPVGPPGPEQVRLRLTASGVNFADVYMRSGLYPTELPCIPGREGVGEVTAIGVGVSNWRIGDRAAFVSVTGSYVESRLIEADRLIAPP
jgi:NADPH:quinone reductase